MATRQEILLKIKKTVSELDPEARIILFGSRARGDYGKESEQAISTLIHHHDHWKKYSITPLYNVIEEEGIEV